MTWDPEKLDSRLERIESKLNDVVVHLAVYNEQLKIHIKGTEVNAQELEILKEEHASFRAYMSALKSTPKTLYSILVGLTAAINLAAVIMHLVYK